MPAPALRRAPSPALLAAFALVLVALPARAALEERDLATPGDALITLDTNTGLRWLETTLTLGQSYDDVAAGAGGWVADGWRHATTTEVCDLFQTYGGIPFPSCPGSVSQGGLLIPTALMGYLGYVVVVYDADLGGYENHSFFDDGPGSTAGIAEILYLVQCYSTPCGPLDFSLHVGSVLPSQVTQPANVGNLLVRDPAVPDNDEDGVWNDADNCPTAPNADQADADSDGVGDACDVCVAVSDPSQADADGDGAGDACDNCLATPNPDQSDADEDGAGDVCDVQCDNGADDDGDGEADFPTDVGCRDAASNDESPQCDDGIDNDQDGKIDWNGNYHDAGADGSCRRQAWRDDESVPTGCGLGGEALLVLPLLRRLQRRRVREG